MTEVPNFTDFTSNIKDLARPNRFLVNFALSRQLGLKIPANFIYHVKTATTPKIDLKGPSVKYRGTSIDLRGDVKNDTLSITFYADTDWDMRKFFESWMFTLADFGLLNFKSNMAQTRFGSSIEVKQFSGANKNFSSYTYFEVTPMDVSEFTLDYSQNDAVLEFTVVFHYGYWEVTTPAGGN